MKYQNFLLRIGLAALLTPLALAHEGHGVPGSFGHDLQHQLWTFGALVLLAALLLSGERIAAVFAERKAASRKKRVPEQRDL